jgi:hypothetical protein
MEQVEKVIPEIQTIHENGIKYQIAAAEKRQRLDLLVATWSNVLHAWLQAIPGSEEQNPKIVHAVIDSMEQFLIRSKR